MPLPKGSLLSLFAVITMLALLVFPVSVLADDGVPPSDEPTTEVVAESAPTEAPVVEAAATEAPVVEAAATEAPVEPVATEPAVETAPAEDTESVAEVVAVLDTTDSVLLDENGEAIPLASEEAAEILAVSDPYVVRAGVTHRFLSECTGQPVDALNTCTVSSTPIQAAVTFAVAGETVVLEAGTFYENIIIDEGITLQGAGQGNTFIYPATSNPNPCANSSLCGSATAASNIIVVQADNVTIHDMTLDGDNPLLSGGIDIDGANIDARNGIVENYYTGVWDSLEVYNVTINNIYLRGIYAASGGSDFHIHDNIVDNVQAEYASIGIFNFGGSGVIEDNTVSDANDAISANWSQGTQFLNNTVINSGSGVHTDNAEAADVISGNTILNGPANSYGIFVFAPYAPVTVQDNTISNVDYGLTLSGNGWLDALNTIAFDRNTVSANIANAYVTSDVWNYFTSDASATFNNNIFTGGQYGFYLESQGAAEAPYGTAYDCDGNCVVDVTAFDNSISGQSIASVFFATGQPAWYDGNPAYFGTYNVDASGNWWGTTDPGTIGPMMATGTDYTPWLDSGADTDGGTAGFQGDFWALHVDDDSAQTGSTGRIQEAINMVDPGGTVYVRPGTYTDTMDIDGVNGISVVGDSRDEVTIAPTTTLPWNVGGYGSSRRSPVRVVNSTAVSLAGMTFDFSAVAGNNIIGLLLWDSEARIADNAFENMSLPDGSGYYYEITSYVRAPSYSDGSRALVDFINNNFTDTGRVGIVSHDFVDLLIQGNTFAKLLDDFGYAIEMGSESIGTIEFNVFHGYDTPAASDGSQSAAIYIENAFTGTLFGGPGPHYDKGVLVRNNEIYDNQFGLWIGNGYDGFAGDVDINVQLRDNSIHDNTDGGVFIEDEDASDGSSVNVFASGNIIANNGTAGYYLNTYGDGSVGLNVLGDTLTGNQTGILVEDNASGASTSLYQMAIHESLIEGNSMGINNGTLFLFDAMGNYWGDTAGPLDDSAVPDECGLFLDNPAAVGDWASQCVLYENWLHRSPFVEGPGGGGQAPVTVVGAGGGGVPTFGSGQQFDIACEDGSWTISVGDHEVTFRGLCGYQASVTVLPESGLPGALPDGTDFGVALEIKLWQDGTQLTDLPGGAHIDIAFHLPAEMAGTGFQGLDWDGEDWVNPHDGLTETDDGHVVELGHDALGICALVGG